MKFQLDQGQGNRIDGYRPGEAIIVNAKPRAESLLISPRELETWPPRNMSELRAGHFAGLASWQPACVVFGSGQRFAFPEPSLLAPLYRAGIGVEVMDTAAACRTYAVLMSEGRQVVAALLLD